jgi:hypothetical protein
MHDMHRVVFYLLFVGFIASALVAAVEESQGDGRTSWEVHPVLFTLSLYSQHMSSA